MLETKVYFHCRLLICKKSSATDECTQKCTKDGNKRRALEEGGIEEVYVNSRKSLLLVGGGVAKTLCPFLKTHNIFKEKKVFEILSVWHCLPFLHSQYHFERISERARILERFFFHVVVDVKMMFWTL